MTSEIESLKTNEFLRRRKLRLQQVREQSKDIAKRIRQRAKVETLRQIGDLDAKKQKEYFDRQEKLVHRLEVLYSRGINNVGASHQSASELNLRDKANKTDLSKSRAKEAAAELRKKRQEKLDEQKKILDRRLQAREAANELSREKSSHKKLQSGDEILKETVIPCTKEIAAEVVEDSSQGKENKEDNKEEPETVTKNDMATQWDIDTVPVEWEPDIPSLKLPKDDQDKEDEYVHSTSDKSKQPDLFAVSKDMPTDLGGRYFKGTTTRNTVRPSLTLVSEYLQNRKLQLRKTMCPNPIRKSSDDILSLKETIQRTRAGRNEGTGLNACHVIDNPLIPIPSWHAENGCVCTHCNVPGSARKCNANKSIANAQDNRTLRSSRRRELERMSGIMPTPILRSTSPYSRIKVYNRDSSAKGNTGTDKHKPENVLTKKNSVLMYNHNTRDVRDLPCSGEPLVVRDVQSSEDAYSQAMKEYEAFRVKDTKDHQKKIQDFRSKVAVTKQAVEKEYKDTMSFLNSLPKDGNKVPRAAFMDERRQQMQKNNRQHRMQQEFRKLEKECRRPHSCLSSNRNLPKTPVKQNVGQFLNRDFQYSWMPVPEGDGNLAVHTIPNTVKGKPGNSVKFSKDDSYHEYRSRHKHTPPTKDTVSYDKNSDKNTDSKDPNLSSDDSSTATNTSSVVDLRINKNTNKQDSNVNQSSDAERIIIYKILDKKSEKHCKKQNKLLSDIAKSLTSMEKVQKSVDEDVPSVSNIRRTSNKSGTKALTGSIEHINEGIYKVTESGDNMSSLQINDDIESCGVTVTEEMEHQRYQRRVQTDDRRVPVPQRQDDKINQQKKSKCLCNSSNKEKIPASNSVTTTCEDKSDKSGSTTSYKSASNDKSGYIQLVDETKRETSKFYVGIPEDNSYEVIIQLRKKDKSTTRGLDSKVQENIPVIATESIPRKSTENIPPLSAENVSTKSLENIPSKLESVENMPIRLEENESTNLAEDVPTKLTINIPTQPVEHIFSSPDMIEQSKNDHLEDELFKAHNIEIQDSITTPFNPQFSKANDLVMTSCKETIVTESDLDKIMNNKVRVQSSTEYKDVAENCNLEQKEHKDFGENCKLDSPSRAATSTYTQTVNSPVHRPVFFHMSSSTSTAYMSPPEVILPNVLRTEYIVAEDDLGLLDEIESAHSRVQYIKTNKKCKHARKLINEVIAKADHTKFINGVPPNTPTSITNKNLQTDDAVKESEFDTWYRNIKTSKSKCKCCNSGCHKERAKTSYPNKKSYISEPNKPLQLRKSTSKTTHFSQNKKNILNVAIRNYINKLLALNREGMRAIDVADQECSSVGTPSSSIINVPLNIDKSKPFVDNKISLQQVKNVLLMQIYADISRNMRQAQSQVSLSPPINKHSSRNRRKKAVHKIKSLNISKQLCKQKNKKRKSTVSMSTTTDDNNKPHYNKPKPHIPASRKMDPDTPKQNTQKITKHINEHLEHSHKKYSYKGNIRKRVNSPQSKEKAPNKVDSAKSSSLKTTPIDSSPDSVSKDSNDYYKNKADMLISMSTQTSQNIDSDFVKVAEDKLQNMEKIAELTEKCTKRLSNLAKVLEEVRKNKTLVYSHISTSDSTDSHSDHKSDHVAKTPVPKEPVDNLLKPQPLKSPEPFPVQEYIDLTEKENSQVTFTPILSGIPKTEVSQRPQSSETDFAPMKIIIRPQPISPVPLDINTPEIMKSKPKPPPALSRIHLKHSHEHIVPHELSTVLEVDSPLSNKNKNVSTLNEIPEGVPKSPQKSKNPGQDSKDMKEADINPDLLQSNLEMPKLKLSPSESSDDSKYRMMDLKQFNEIMLEPFISIHEYAKKYNIVVPDEGSNIEDAHKDEPINDDMSSLHSDGSLPDVIAELLKRNIITEPFKFDSPSNVNSNTLSSESTLSMLAMSKVRKGKRRPNVTIHNKENIGETSDTMSISSNPDLENAFKRLGMGWASSTLKKTKERLALSSSSNSSSSSLLLFQNRNFNIDAPALVTDSVSSVLLSKKGPSAKTENTSKNNEEQTRFANSAIVKEFLANELANKITFIQSSMNNTDDEFVSLMETKIPDGMKRETLDRRDQSNEDSIRSGTNRARTSTPVQLYKSMIYQSSSSSNLSNGLFSNADDLSSVKMTSKNHSTSDKDDLSIPNFSLKLKKSLDCSKSD